MNATAHRQAGIEPPRTWRRGARAGLHAHRAEDALGYLTPELIDELACLQGMPVPVAQAAAQLLPFGSRAALEAIGVVQASGASDEYGHQALQLTPFGWEVIAAAADSVEASDRDVDTQSIRALTDRVRAAAQVVDAARPDHPA